MPRAVTAMILALVLTVPASAENYYRSNPTRPVWNGPNNAVATAGTGSSAALVPDPTPAPAPDPTPAPAPAAQASGVNYTPVLGEAARGRIVVSNYAGTPTYALSGAADGVDIGQDGAFTGNYQSVGPNDFTVMVFDDAGGLLSFVDMHLVVVPSS